MKLSIKFFKQEFLWPSMLALVFLIMVWWLPATTPLIFNSPDEMANFYFSQQVAEQSRLSVPEPLNLELGDRVYPRSVKSNNGLWQPWSFIGLPVFYGFLGKLFTARAIPYITGLVAALGGIIFYLLLRQWFNRLWAIFGAAMLFFHPAYLYYSARGLFHNVLFVDLALAALFFVGITGAVLLFAAIAVRTIEGVWLWPILVWVKDRRFKIMAMLIVLANVLLLWKIKPGYPTDLFPFGVSWRRIAAQFWNIHFKLLYWYTIPAIVGAIIWWKKQWSKRYLVAGGLGAAWLSFYYGTYVIVDNPSGELTIVSSLFRYWLPVFIFEIPFVLLFWQMVASALKKTWWRYGATIVVAILFLLFGMRMVWLGPDGLYNVREKIKQFGEIKQTVLSLTEASAVIIADRGADKIFFPDRRVMYDLRDLLNIPHYKKLVSLVPTYYYGIGLHHNDPIIKILSEQGIGLERIAIFGKEALYKLKSDLSQ